MCVLLQEKYKDIKNNNSQLPENLLNKIVPPTIKTYEKYNIIL